MAAACASDFTSPLQQALLARLQSRNIVVVVSLHDVVKSTAFPVLRAMTVKRKQRFMATHISCMSNAVPQSSGVGGGGISEVGGDDEFGPNLNFEEVMKETEARGVILPSDMLEAAKSTGIPKLFLLRYLSMQGLGWGVGFGMRSCSMFRNQMMIDPSYIRQHRIKFSFDIIVDSIAVIAMKRGGRTSKEIITYLLIRLFVKVLNIGFMAPFDSRMRQQRANGHVPLCNNSMIEAAERSKLLTRAIYCCATMIFTGLMVLLYGKTVSVFTLA